MVEEKWEDLSIGINALSKAVGECLMGYSGLFRPFPEVFPNGNISFLLQNDELGEIGKIIISKRPGDRSAIEFILSEAEREEPIPEELAASMGMAYRLNEELAASTGTEYRLNIEYAARVEIIKQEREKVTRSRKELLEEIEAIFLKLFLPGWDIKRKEKRGRHGLLTRAEKMQAVRDWDSLNPDTRPRLCDWLDSRFENLGGVPSVSLSTFHGWRKLKKR
jgi:hypothetical protein